MFSLILACGEGGKGQKRAQVYDPHEYLGRLVRPFSDCGSKLKIKSPYHDQHEVWACSLPEMVLN